MKDQQMKMTSMKRSVLLQIFVAMLTVSTAYTANAKTPRESQPRQNSAQSRILLDLSRQKWVWMAERKTDQLATLFHHDAAFVHMGATLSKDQELDVISTGKIHYKRADIQDASVKIMGDTAILLNKLRLDAVVGGNEVTNPFVVTEVYVRQRKGWKLASMSFTRLLGD
jgi:ketosteroid isomerase-like protein